MYINSVEAAVSETADIMWSETRVGVGGSVIIHRVTNRKAWIVRIFND